MQTRENIPLGKETNDTIINQNNDFGIFAQLENQMTPAKQKHSLAQLMASLDIDTSNEVLAKNAGNDANMFAQLDALKKSIT